MKVLVRSMLLLSALSGLAVISPEAAGAAGSKDVIYVLYVERSGIEAELEINNVPVFSTDEKKSAFRTTQAQLNSWLKPGKNTVVFRLKKVLPKDEPKVKLYIAAAAEGQFPDEGKKVVEFSWEAGKSKDKQAFEKKFEFSQDAVPALDIWTKTEPLKSDPESLKGAMELYAAFAKAHENRDADAVVKLSEFSLSEMGRASHRSINKEELKEMMKEMFNLPKGVVMKSLDAASVEKRIIGEGRLLLLTGKDGKPLITTGRYKDSDGSTTEFLVSNVVLARVNGKWVMAGRL